MLNIACFGLIHIFFGVFCVIRLGLLYRRRAVGLGLGTRTPKDLSGLWLGALRIQGFWTSVSLRIQRQSKVRV